MFRCPIILVRYKKMQALSTQHANETHNHRTNEENEPESPPKTRKDSKVKPTAAQQAITTDDGLNGENKQKLAPITQQSKAGQQANSVSSSRSIKRPLQESQENIPMKKKYKTTEKKPADSVRYDELRHYPEIDKSRIVRCKYEGCNKKTYIFCSKCNVHLCLCTIENRNCFTKFHIRECDV